MNHKILRMVMISGIASLLVGASYFLMKKFLTDREKLASYDPTAMRRAALRRRTPEPTTKVYTQKEIEEARKKGHPLPGTQIPNLPPSNTAADAAVQRSLKTLEDINRINEMNRRLTEQQQRQK